MSVAHGRPEVTAVLAVAASYLGELGGGEGAARVAVTNVLV